MKVISIISFAISAALFTYLIGATLGSPVGQVSDDVVTTVVPEVSRDDVDATTQGVLSDDVAAVTGESVTHRARQEGEDENEDEDDDATTVAAVPVPSTRAPVPPPPRNESSVISEFNFVSQSGNPAPVVVKAVPSGVPIVDDEKEAAAVAVPVGVTAAPAQPEGDEDENEIRDEAVTTGKPVVVAEDVEANREQELWQRGIPKSFDEKDLTYGGLNLSALLDSSFQGEGRAGCECGKLPFKIPVNEQSGINPTPWLAAIVRGGLFAGGRPHCAGTLINDLYVLTSASCMDGLYATSAQVWLTAHDSFEFNHASFGNLKLQVQDVLMHPNYNRRTKDNDIALLKLSSSVDISGKSYFVPACLPAGNFDFAGTMAKVTGWSDGRDFRMCKGEMPILDNKICDRDSRHSGKITSNMVCAGFLTPTRVETCIGDAGGPLISPNGGRSTLVGVVSWGYEAKNKDYSPTVYTRISEFSDWILHNTREADWCGI